jgi:hypothetical protein
MSGFTRADLFNVELRRLINEEIDRLKDEIAGGLLKSYEDYRAASGKVVGLRQCLEYMDEADDNVRKRISS